MRSLQKSQPAVATKTGAKFASSVAFATEVMPMDRCHTARSAAKNSPAATSA